ncbi:hypothetical protein RHDC4_02795 [Rhodocyclaceae bacterium]|nr:hypothetical protein RHDC4_02795 [Rhodocyclaceae bacterium]
MNKIRIAETKVHFSRIISVHQVDRGIASTRR